MMYPFFVHCKCSVSYVLVSILLVNDRIDDSPTHGYNRQRFLFMIDNAYFIVDNTIVENSVKSVEIVEFVEKI